MDEEQVRQLIEEALTARGVKNAFNVSLIPYHQHNGVDSARVSAEDISLQRTTIMPRVASTTTTATPTPNAGSTDLFDITAQTATAAFQAPINATVNGQILKIRITSSATGTTIPLTWSATGYIGNSPALPSTTTTGKTSNLGFEYDMSNSVNKWRLIYSANS